MNSLNENQATYDLRNFTIRDMTECARALRSSGTGAKSMEEAANGIVRQLYNTLIDGQTGARACALVRFFKTHHYQGLDEELRSFARGMMGNTSPAPDMKCLVLLATAGDDLSWNDRSASQGHKAIPLPSAEVINQLPMIRNLINQFGLEINMVIRPVPELLLDLEQRNYNVFLVPEALGNPAIPAQREFVIPLGIRSVLGFGGLLPSGNVFVVIMFSKMAISRQVADLFKNISLSIKIAVLPFENNVFS
jgi:hypothetical protein